MEYLYYHGTPLVCKRWFALCCSFLSVLGTEWTERHAIDSCLFVIRATCHVQWTTFSITWYSDCSVVAKTLLRNHFCNAHTRSQPPEAHTHAHAFGSILDCPLFYALSPLICKRWLFLKKICKRWLLCRSFLSVHGMQWTAKACNWLLFVCRTSRSQWTTFSIIRIDTSYCSVVAFFDVVLGALSHTHIHIIIKKYIHTWLLGPFSQLEQYSVRSNKTLHVLDRSLIWVQFALNSV